MFDMSYNIEFNTDGKKYRLTTLNSVEIDESVERLVDTAIITLPESVLNSPLNIESKIKRGTEVVIQLGYNSSLKNEFTGFVTEVKNNSSSLQIICEDALFLFRKSIPDTVFKPAPLNDVLQYLINNVDPTYTLVCDFDFSYEKYVIHKAEAYDVLKKIQEELKANIFFNTEKKELHVHAPYREKSGHVKFRMNKNIESSSLEFKRAEDRKVEVTIECTGADGKLQTVKIGEPGGETISRKVSATNDLMLIAENELITHMADKYEGTVTSWLIPIVKPTYTIDFEDEDYPEKAGLYYAVAVKTSFSESGASRTTTFGVKLSK